MGTWFLSPDCGNRCSGGRGCRSNGGGLIEGCPCEGGPCRDGPVLIGCTEEGRAGLGGGQVVDGEGVHAGARSTHHTHTRCYRCGTSGNGGDDDGALLEAKPRLQFLEVFHLAGVDKRHLVHHTYREAKGKGERRGKLYVSMLKRVLIRIY